MTRWVSKRTKQFWVPVVLLAMVLGCDTGPGFGLTLATAAGTSLVSTIATAVGTALVNAVIPPQ